MIEEIRRSVEEWAGRGHWLTTMLKTALSHAAVLAVCIVVPAAMGFALMLATGLSPVFAITLPLIGFAEGWRLYRDRELLPEGGDFFEADSWKGRLDAALDIVVPLLVGPPLMYGVTLLYSLGGL